MCVQALLMADGRAVLVDDNRHAFGPLCSSAAEAQRFLEFLADRGETRPASLNSAVLVSLYRQFGLLCQRCHAERQFMWGFCRTCCECQDCGEQDVRLVEVEGRWLCEECQPDNTSPRLLAKGGVS